jgi:c-src tyrosine kinase
VSKDRNWYKARRYDGLEGMIPFNYVMEKSPDASVVHRSHSPPPPIDAKSDSLKRDDSAVIEKRGIVKLHTMPWFHGNITRSDSEKLLSPLKDGLFLVRESQAFKGNYTLCVCFKGKVEHYQIMKDSKEWVSADGEEYFENLVKLVEHYQHDADGLVCKLRSSVEKTGAHDIVVSTEEFKKKGWAIPRSDLDLKSMIGKGEFGEVWLGEYKGNKVAVKMLKDIKIGQATQQFLAEASVMTTLSHPNLVGLIGVSLDDQPIYLITEFMAKGSLEQYLRSRGRAVVTKQNQIDFARDVCKGMVYLESKNFIHRDLASRNVLLAEDMTAKVSDFGLAREGVTRSDSQKLPVKWTAPEALKQNKFSNKSDVWSFGILLWEIYSYARVPYPRVPANDIMQHIERGYRMDAPDGCPDQIYHIMKDCWATDPASRPNFTRIMKGLDTFNFS